MKSVAIALFVSFTLQYDTTKENIIRGDLNTIRGSGNAIDGERNNLIGFHNILKGYDNVALLSNSDISGDDNWLVGSGVNYAGSGLRMFGPNTSPEIRARWRVFN